jgi:hypothetical protein
VGEHTTRIVDTDTGIVLDGQRVEGDNVKQTPWYASVSRLGVPVSTALNDGISVEVHAESVIGVRFAAIPDTLTLELVQHQGQEDLEFEQGIFDVESFLSAMRHSWVIARDTVYFLAWFPESSYRPLDGEWFVDRSEDTPAAFIPILAMVAIKAHTENFRMKDGAFCTWLDEIDPTLTSKRTSFF